MLIRVRLFALAKDLTGSDTLTLDLPAAATVGDLRKLLAQTHPRLAALLKRSALAVSDEFADDALELRAGSDVALLPPVSGG